MRIVLAGGTGQMGRMLIRAFSREGCDLVTLSRSRRDRAACRSVQWNGREIGDWMKEIDGADVVINLAGRSVDCRYHRRNREEILRSRVDSTRAIGKAIREAKRPPALWLQSSTATIYAHRFDAANGEENGIIGGNEADVPDTWRFSIEVAKAWEAAAMEAGDLPATRRVLLRSAMVMAPDRGGVFDTLLRLARFGLGGRMGSGKQFVSWIHERDFTRAVSWLIAREDIDGPINLAAPCPLPNHEFMRALRQACGARIGIPSPQWMLELGAFFLRTETELILKSRRVVPGRLLREGFQFEYPDWPNAARDLCERRASLS